MISEKNIQKIVEDFLEKLCLEGKVAISIKDAAITIQISSEEKDLVGYNNGGTLLAIQHLIRLIARRSLQNEEYSLYVDVNGYWKEKEEKLVAESQEVLRELLNGSSEQAVLRPMNAHERKIIHDTIAAVDGVRTESIDQGGFRCVQIIKELS